MSSGDCFVKRYEPYFRSISSGDISFVLRVTFFLLLCFSMKYYIDVFLGEIETDSFKQI